MSLAILHCETMTGRNHVSTWAVAIIGPCLVSSRLWRFKSQYTPSLPGYVLIVSGFGIQGACWYDTYPISGIAGRIVKKYPDLFAIIIYIPIGFDQWFAPGNGAVFSQNFTLSRFHFINLIRFILVVRINSLKFFLW